MRAVTLSYNRLMKLIYSTQLKHHIHVPERKLRNIKRHAENLTEFYAELEKQGGTLKVNLVADILGFTHQVINLRLKKNRLLAFKKNGDYIFPAFQFTQDGMLPYFAQVMEAIVDNTIAITRFSFLIMSLGKQADGFPYALKKTAHTLCYTADKHWIPC